MSMLKFAFVLIISAGAFGKPNHYDYKPTCIKAEERLNERAKSGLSKLLGNKSLEYLADHISHSAEDTVDYYTKPLTALRISGPYRLRKFDEIIKPLNLTILNGINKFERTIGDEKQTRKDRLFAVEVLIGLYTALEMPMQGITNIPTREGFINHDIFIKTQSRQIYKVSPVASLLYDSYKLGIRVKQAGDDRQMVASFTAQGYGNAGRYLGISLNHAFIPPGVMELGEGPGKIIEPGKEPIYDRGAVPAFPGGGMEFYKFLGEKLHYPKEEWEKGIEGFEYIEFVVEKDGTLSHIKVGPFTPNIDSEASRVIKLSPKWKPGTLGANGPVVRSQFSTIIKFSITSPDENIEDAFKSLYPWN